MDMRIAEEFMKVKHTIGKDLVVMDHGMDSESGSRNQTVSDNT